MDAHSKWLEVHIVPSTSAAATIDKLRVIFAMFGLPEQIVSDNGSGFTSAEFKNFIDANGIKHTLTSPYHPSSNGLAERAVQTFKTAVRKLKGPMELRISKFLFKYRIRPQSTTDISPAQMLMLRSHLDLLHPDTGVRVLEKQEKSVTGKSPRCFAAGDRVYVKNFNGPGWVAGEVVSVTGPVSYRVKTGDGLVVRRHVDHVRRRHAEETVPTIDPESDDGWTAADAFPDKPVTNPTDPQPSQAPVRQVPIRRSTRSRPPVDRFSPSRYT